MGLFFSQHEKPAKLSSSVTSKILTPKSSRKITKSSIGVVSNFHFFLKIFAASSTCFFEVISSKFLNFSIEFCRYIMLMNTFNYSINTKSIGGEL